LAIFVPQFQEKHVLPLLRDYTAKAISLMAWRDLAAVSSRDWTCELWGGKL
jgi:hypothetical protein